MIPLLKAEFRKILTVRSTYVIIGVSILMIIFFAFFVDGYKTNVPVKDPGWLAKEALLAIQTVGLIGSIVGILIMTHEYRYNTIVYTLTSSKSRTKVLLAKIIAISCFALVFSLFCSALSPLAAYTGLHLKGIDLVPQVVHLGDVLWRCLFVGWGYSMLGLIIATLLRNQMGTIVSLFVIPTTIETLLGLLLKKNGLYLPFTALQSVAQHHPEYFISYSRAAIVVTAYIVIGWLIAWQLFLRRDAN